tara:strand:+ start:4577 stop:4915 length:339 start_codon:yes stop_codon:yes gene_type:complete
MNRPFTTPESAVNRCPKCDNTIQLEPTSIFGQYSCKQCDSTLWFLAAGDTARFFEYTEAESLREFVIDFIAERLEIDSQSLAANPDLLNSSDTDSLERLEILMELEETLELV